MIKSDLLTQLISIIPSAKLFNISDDGTINYSNCDNTYNVKIFSCDNTADLRTFNKVSDFNMFYQCAIMLGANNYKITYDAKTVELYYKLTDVEILQLNRDIIQNQLDEIDAKLQEAQSKSISTQSNIKV